MKKGLKILSIVLVVAMCCVLLAGCAGKAKGQLVYGTTTEANGDWSYALFSNNATDNAVISLTDSCLTVETDKSGNYVVSDSVVKKLETAEDADGNKTYTITINKGLKFNNGDPITAKNFVALTLFASSPAGKELGLQSAVYNMVMGGDVYRSGKSNVLAGVRLIDEYTFSYTAMKIGYDGNSYLPYYYDLGYAAFRAISPSFWFGEGWDVKDDGQGCYLVNTVKADAKFDAATIGEAVKTARFKSSDRVSAGPYNLVSFDESSRQITLEVNENYAGNYEGQKAGIAKLVIVKAEQDTIMDMLSTGQVEMYADITDGKEVNAALDLIDNGLNSSYVKFDRAGYGKIQFVCDFGPTQFKEVRQAVAHLLNRNEFASTFCQGWGGVVNGPYCSAFSMAQDSKDLFAEKLNNYEYSVDAAKQCLVAAGFVLNADGTAYDEAAGGMRYKKVTAAEAGTFKHNVTLADGTILMPAIIEWFSSEGNSVSDLLAVMLKENPDVVTAGMQINQTVGTFADLINYLYRDGSVGDQYAVPTYAMFNLATGWNAAIYDYSYEWTTDPEIMALGYNTNRLVNKTLDDLSMQMVYGVESTDYATFLDTWQKYIIEWNDQVPDLPLYQNIYVTVFPNTIKGYEESSFWGFEHAILYCTYKG